MKELIFSVADIFNGQNQSGCLTQYESSFYHIPAYQRGYKWASTKNGAVTILLNDLWNAFEGFQEQEKKEYYLQYITVKKIKIDDIHCVEVIDGQQRLTTLSILTAVLALKLQKENISENKLDYAIRDNFFTEHVYNKENLEFLLNTSWEEFAKNELLNKQDVFYFHSALRNCNSFFEKKTDLESFYLYLLNNIKLIVNSVEPHVVSETVFKNLNSNKVPLTEAELIKGLLITKIGRQNNNSFREAMEVRANAGMYWDEISSWANRNEIKSFYFNNKQDAMHELLHLTALCMENESISINPNTKAKDFPLFNFFHEHNDFTHLFDKIKAIKNTLDDWFATTEIYNLIGFLRFSKNTGNNNPIFLKNLLDIKTRSGIIEHLENKKKEMFNDLYLSDLSYSETPDELHHILLALNVFIKGQETIRFNFFEFEQQKWSLEHIFPQSPEGKKKVLKQIDKDAIINILSDTITSEVSAVLALDKRTEEDKHIYYQALQNHWALNSIGNMCLLSGADNASNGNKFFDKKRENILKRLQIGSFVPKHTFDVFSKMFEDANVSQMNLWSLTDITAHKEHIKNSLGLKETNSTSENEGIE